MDPFTAALASESYPELEDILDRRPPLEASVPTNVSSMMTSLSKVARGGIGVPQKCKYCDNPATKAHVWAEGAAYVPTCVGCADKAIESIGGPVELDYVKEIPQKTATHSFSGPCESCGRMHYTNPKRTKDGYFKCVVCNSEYDDGSEARDCAISDHIHRMGSAKEGSWADVQQKAIDIYKIGGVRIIAHLKDSIAAHVLGDHGTYLSEIQFFPDTKAPSIWTCSCPWAAYSWGRSGRWKKYEGRICSHVLALLYEYQHDPNEVAVADWDEDPITFYNAPPPGDWKMGSYDETSFEELQAIAMVANRNSYDEELWSEASGVPDEIRDANGRWTDEEDNSDINPITESEARGNSRLVSMDEFRKLHHKGKSKFDDLVGERTDSTALNDPEQWQKVKDSAYDSTRESWGGQTIDTSTGKPINPDTGYAVAITKPGQEKVQIHPDATKEEFHAAMDKAKSTYDEQLGGKDVYLGVFKDDDENRIDIDPVAVVHKTHDVETLGAYCHSVGGAYDFSTGDGYFPPHVKGGKTADVKKTADAHDVSDEPRDETGEWTTAPGSKRIEPLEGDTVKGGHQAFDLRMHEVPKKVRKLVINRLTHGVGADPKTALHNIVAQFERTPPAVRDEYVQWYFKTHDLSRRLGKANHVNPHIVAAIIAASSAGASWSSKSGNKDVAQTIVEEASPKNRKTPIDDGLRKWINERLTAPRFRAVKGQKDKVQMPPLTDWQIPAGASIDDVFHHIQKETPDTQHKILGMVVGKKYGFPVGYGYGNYGKAMYLALKNDPDEIETSLNGPKIRSFFNNIEDPANHKDVTVDIHMWRSFVNDGGVDRNATFKKYENIEKHQSGITGSPSFLGIGVGAYPIAADILHMATGAINAKHGTNYTPSQVQAVVWGNQRNEWPVGEWRKDDHMAVAARFVTAEEVDDKPMRIPVYYGFEPEPEDEEFIVAPDPEPHVTGKFITAEEYVTLYHGTDKANVDSIKESGIRPTDPARSAWNIDHGHADPVVYLAKKPDDARGYGFGDEDAVIEVRVPKSKIEKYPMSSTLMHHGTIPPEQIISVSKTGAIEDQVEHALAWDNKDARQILVDAFGSHGNDYMHGGCLVAAQAIQEVTGGTIKALINYREDYKDRIRDGHQPMVQHYVVQVGPDTYLDASGAHTGLEVRGSEEMGQFTSDPAIFPDGVTGMLIDATPELIAGNRGIATDPAAVKAVADLIRRTAIKRANRNTTFSRGLVLTLSLHDDPVDLIHRFTDGTATANDVMALFKNNTLGSFWVEGEDEDFINDYAWGEEDLRKWKRDIPEDWDINPGGEIYVKAYAHGSVPDDFDYTYDLGGTFKGDQVLFLDKVVYSPGEGEWFTVAMGGRRITAVKDIEPDQVNGLIDGLAHVPETGTFNLCDVDVDGTNLFCQQSLSIDRADMPQLQGEPEAESLATLLAHDERGKVNIGPLLGDYLQEVGHHVELVTVDASTLKASQNQLNGEKVAMLRGIYEEGKLDAVPIVVSSDNYIVDGHHRWAAIVAAEYDEHTKIPIEIMRVDVAIRPLLVIAKEFAGSMGIPQEDLMGDKKATLHDDPEPALPSTDGADDDQEDGSEIFGDNIEKAMGIGGYVAGMDTDEPDADVQDSGYEIYGDNEQEAEGMGGGTIGSVQGPAWLDPSRGESGGQFGDSDIAQAARQYLAVKNFNRAEQEELINEGEGYQAANLASLDLSGTHYEPLEEALAMADASGESILWW